MKRHIIFLLLIVTTLAASAKTKHLLILHTNDTHSTVYPINSNLNDTAIAGRGGYLRRVKMIEAERRKHPDLLLFDSGDFSQGSPYYNIYKGDIEVGLMNRMHYDAATIGNHEFDFGLENMARLFREAQFPIVCANYDFTGTPLEGIVKPYVVLKRQGVKIGVFGLSPQLYLLVDDANCAGVTFRDPVATADSIARILKEQLKCDVVICISHLGWNIGGYDDNNVISHTHNIDLVLGGHSHTYLKQLQYVRNDLGKEVPDDQNGKHAVWVGRIELTLEK